ncbi:diguanylate cyclase domain-containing protein [Ehrlichia japonica]|uniref:GGDEF domain protein n=1 Tax=Ehrlichia japonica TaxID=391036 RepID=X5GLE7_9RICK|nr:diguanylate cyclase [Ehrlichia japonica]AHX04961.1 GGDEF domain protein [Ehrlichia japonica]
MNHFVVARRSDDSVISVQQNNTLQNLTISNLNKAAETLLDYTAEELSNKPLSTILHKNIVENINSYLEYTSDGIDLFDILSKTRNCSLVGKNNKIIPVIQKVFRTTASNQDIINYEILVRNASISQKLDIFRQSILSNKKYNMHSVFNIIDEVSTKTEIKIVLDFLHKHNTYAILSMIQLNPPYNKSSIDTLTQHIINLLYKNVRESDIIGYIGDYKIICILLGCKSEHAYSAISRIHKNINNNLQNFHANVSIGYAQMYNEIDTEQILTNVSNTLFIAQQEAAGGTIKSTNIP